MFEPAKLQMNCANANGAINARGERTQPAVTDPGAVTNRSRYYRVKIVQ